MINLKTTSSLSLLKLRTGSKTFLTILGMAAAGVIAAHAQQMQLIDIGNTTAPGTEPTTGYMTGSAVLGTTSGNTTDYWNTLDLRDVHSFTLDNALDKASGVSLDATGFQGENYSGADSVGGLAPALFENFGYEFAANGGTSTLDFSGLAKNSDYTLELYNLNDGSDADTTYTVNGVTSTLEQVGKSTYTSTLTTSSVDPGTVYSGNYISLTGVSDASGNLDITLKLAPSNTSNNGPQDFSYMAFTGLQLYGAVAPEPSTFALMAAGLAGLAFFTYRRRA